AGAILKVYGNEVLPPLVDTACAVFGPEAVAEVEADWYGLAESSRLFERDHGLALKVSAPWPVNTSPPTPAWPRHGLAAPTATSLTTRTPPTTALTPPPVATCPRVATAATARYRPVLSSPTASPPTTATSTPRPSPTLRPSSRPTPTFLPQSSSLRPRTSLA